MIRIAEGEPGTLEFRSISGRRGDAELKLSSARKKHVFRVAAFGAGLLLLAGCGGKKKPPETIVSVQAVTAGRSAIRVVVRGEALLAPLHQAVLSAKISAPVQHFYVQRGQRVHKGELLAVLENKDLSGAALGSQGQYQQAKAQY